MCHPCAASPGVREISVAVPPEVLKELGLRAGGEIRFVELGGEIFLSAPGALPDAELLEFAADFDRRYGNVLRNLADR